MAQYLDKTGLAYYHSKTIATVSKTLTACTASGGAKALMGGEYVCNIKPQQGYAIQSVTVTMGGVDITSSVLELKEASDEYATKGQVSSLIAEALAEFGDGDTETYG